MSANDTYRSIAEPSRGLFRDNGSRFLAFAFPVESEEQVKQEVAALKKEYHDARHHCFAYRIGKDGLLWRSNDDGEPSGSAGRPILGQIDSAGLSDVLVVVVRYFGGIKLGIPGLIRAYKTSAAEALAAAPLREKIAGEWRYLKFAYSALPSVMKMVKDMEFPQRNQSFAEVCSMEIFVRSARMGDYCERLKKMDIFDEH